MLWLYVFIWFSLMAILASPPGLFYAARAVLIIGVTFAAIAAFAHLTRGNKLACAPTIERNILCS